MSTTLFPLLDFLRERIEVGETFFEGEILDDFWRSAVQNLDRSIFDSLVSGNIQLSEIGVFQLEVDLKAIFSLFSKFASKPEAFFKRLREVLRLLKIPLPEASKLLSQLSKESQSIWLDERKMREILVNFGIKTLSPHQSADVLHLRKKLFQSFP